MDAAIQKLFVLSFLVTGLSHIVRPRAWVRFFTALREKGEAGSFAVAFLHFWPGALIVTLFDKWRGIPLVLTLIGWGWVLKSAIYFIFPSVGLRSLARVSDQRAWEFVAGGVLLTGLGALLLFDLLR